MSDSETTSLYHITQLPLDADAEIFRRYAAFKLGVTAAVRHYAQLLLPLAKHLILSDSKHADWILTAPPIVAHTPAGANLLSWELFNLYTRDSKQLSLIDMHYDNAATASADYARMDFADRVKEREQLSRRLIHNADFHGRPILFVNDISVTGAQQQAMQEYFELAGAACVKWLYLIVVDPEIGRMKPDLEWQINFAPFEDLLRMVSAEEIQFTGKCVQRLMHLSVPELKQILRALDTERRRRLLELAILNNLMNDRIYKIFQDTQDKSCQS
jgi:PRTase ComF-like